MLSLKDVSLDRLGVGFASPVLTRPLVIHELRNLGGCVEGFIGRQLLRRRPGSAGCRELFQGGLPAAIPVAG